VLHIHRAERADALVGALAELLSVPLADPFASEVVAVPTRGMERWLAQRMSARLGASARRADGVCANVAFPSPHRLVGAALAAACGVEPDEDPWLPERCTWALLDVVDAALGEPWLAGLTRHLGGGANPPDPVRRGRRLSVVRHLAGLFDRYALQRPEMVRAWARGSYAGEILPNSAWQAELWRRLRARIALESPAERLESACALLREDPSIVDLPPRVALFGLTRIPAGHLTVLRALAELRDVHLFLLHPSNALWQRIAATAHAGIVSRRDDQTAELPANRLLASWSRDAREMQLVLAGGERADHHHPVAFASDTLLARIQAAVRADEPPPGLPLPGEQDRRPLLDPGDRSLQVHACHGRARQVEVVRDAILHALIDDPTLEPRDVIVMCPDIETFAPLLQATFGAGEAVEDVDGGDSTPARPQFVDLRVRLADRSLHPTNPVLAVVAQLLELAGERVTASQVLDLIDREPVRRRFGFDDEALARMKDWIGAANIRWGLDAAHRAPFKLDAVAAGTWRAGLDRLLLGVTMTEDRFRLFHGVLPLDDVESGAIDLAGRLAEFVARLGRALDALSRPQPIAEWALEISRAADSLAATRDRDDWQRLALARLLDDVVAGATLGGTAASTPLAPAEVRSLLAERLEGRPTRSNFRTGHLTICTLHPMRSVPHRVVCLLGLDDDTFPRKALRDGDDLMLDRPRIGERDPRSEDRQLLLDALLAATERMIITYTGNDERTNTLRPPAVPVGELLDVVDATVRAPDARASERVVVHHPLQPFDPRNFAPGALIPRTSWSLDPVALDGARALKNPLAPRGPFLAQPLPALETSLVEVEDLVRFVAHPVRAFLRERLRIRLADESDETRDDLPLELDGLERWGVGQRLVEARLAGVDGRAAVLAEIARGALPPGVLGMPIIDDVYAIADAIADETEKLLAGGAADGIVDARVELADGCMVSGTVARVSGDLLVTTTYSTVAAKHRLAAWVRLLAATAAHPQRPFSAVTVGRAGRRAMVAIVRIPPLAGDAEDRQRTALAQLAMLVDLYRRGMREPLPIYCKSSAAYASAAAAGRDAQAAASSEWTSKWDYSKEDGELEHQLVLGGVLAFAELLEAVPAADEQGPGWEMSETSRLGRYARRLWDGLLVCEELTSR
jgi:exodeoxyribonuclease V gamma subunit